MELVAAFHFIQQGNLPVRLGPSMATTGTDLGDPVVVHIEGAAAEATEWHRRGVQNGATEPSATPRRPRLVYGARCGVRDCISVAPARRQP